MSSGGFKKGDAVVHSCHGAGRVVNIQTWQVGDSEGRYYCIELASGEGTLMIPIEQAEEAGLRLAISNSDAIVEVLLDKPQELDEDYRARQSHLADKIHSGDPRLVAQALRDLVWREKVDSLSSKDAKLKAEAQDLLASELSLQPDMDMESATKHLGGIIRRAIQTHLPSIGAL